MPEHRLERTRRAYDSVVSTPLTRLYTHDFSQEPLQVPDQLQWRRPCETAAERLRRYQRLWNTIEDHGADDHLGAIESE